MRSSRRAYGQMRKGAHAEKQLASSEEHAKRPLASDRAKASPGGLGVLGKVGHGMLSLLLAFFVSGAWSLSQTSMSYGAEVTNKSLINSDFSYLQREHGFWDIVEAATNGNFRAVFDPKTGDWYARKLDASGNATSQIATGTLRDYDPSGFGFSSTAKADEHIPEGGIELLHDVDGSTYPETAVKSTSDYFYQDIVTVPGETYHWSFMVAGYGTDKNGVHLNLGAPGQTTQQIGRLAKQNSTNGGSVYYDYTFYSKGSTHSENDNYKNFTTFEGDYTIPAGQTVTRIHPTVSSFSNDEFRWASGNYIKDITFAPVEPWIEVASTEGGTISNAGQRVRFDYGDELTFSIMPDEGYELADLQLDGKSVLDDVEGNDGSATRSATTMAYTAKNLSTWATLQAVFEPSSENEADQGSTGTDENGDPENGDGSDGNGSSDGNGADNGSGDGDGNESGSGSGDGDGNENEGDGVNGNGGDGGNGEGDDGGSNSDASDGNGSEIGNGGNGNDHGGNDGDGGNGSTGSGNIDNGSNGMSGTGSGNDQNGEDFAFAADGNGSGNSQSPNNGSGGLLGPDESTGGSNPNGIGNGTAGSGSNDQDANDKASDGNEMGLGDEGLPDDEADNALDVSLIDEDERNGKGYASGALANAGDGLFAPLFDGGTGAIAFGSLMTSALYLLLVWAKSKVQRRKAISC